MKYPLLRIKCRLGWCGCHLVTRDDCHEVTCARCGEVQLKLPRLTPPEKE